MNVLLVLDSLGTGGTERQMESLLRHWPGDDRVEVCALASGGAATSRYEALVPVHVLARRGRLDLRQAGPLRDLVRARGMDVVLAGHRYAGLVCKVATLWGLDVPVVCSIRGWHPFSPLQRVVYDVVDLALMRRAAGVVINSMLVADGLRERFWFAGETIVIPNGVETTGTTRSRTEAREHFGIPAEAPLIVSVGRLVEVKDPVVAVETLTGVRHRGHDAHLLWIGDGPMRETVEHAVQEHGLDDVAHFPGAVDDPADALVAADVLLHTSRWENMSNAILEAMVAGLPVVARDVGGNRELVTDAVSGRLGDDLAVLVAELLEDPERARAMGAAGRARAVEEFSMPGAVARYRDLFSAVVARASKAGVS